MVYDDMNFASHYFFQGGSSDFFNAGLILADLIPLSQKNPFPLMPAVRKLLHDDALTEAGRELFTGIDSHFTADVIFHRSDFFHSAVSESIRITGARGSIPSPLHHILVELYMDRFLLISKPATVSEMYESFGRCFRESLDMYAKHLPLQTETVQACERFSYNRTVEKYGDFAVIAEILTAIGNRTRIPLKADSGLISRMEQTYSALEPSISEYFDTLKTVFRDITPL
jgi:hypothetical protein